MAPPTSRKVFSTSDWASSIGEIAECESGSPASRRLPCLLAVDHVGLGSHLGPDRDEHDGEGDDDDRPDRERQPAAQPEPRPAAAHRFDQPVADRAHGLDRRRGAGRVELAPEVADVDLDDVRARVVVVAPDRAEDLLVACRPGPDGASGRRAGPPRARAAGPSAPHGSPRVRAGRAGSPRPRAWSSSRRRPLADGP